MRSASTKKRALGRRPEVAIAASWILPGLGQLYLGARGPGLVLVAISLALAIPVWAQLVPFVVLVGPLLAVCLYSQFDVWRRAGVSPRDYLEPRAPSS